MLIVVLKSKRNYANYCSTEQNQLQLHVPFTNNPKLINEEIDWIQADCDELDVIFSTFGERIPIAWREPNMGYKSVQRWYGDIAKTIYFNL